MNNTVQAGHALRARRSISAPQSIADLRSRRSTAAWYVMQRTRRRRRRNSLLTGIGNIADMPGDFIAQFQANTIPLGIGDPIDVWPDLSGNVYDASQESTSCQPTLESVTFAGKTFRTARFDNVNDGMSTPINLDPNVPFSIFTMWRPNALGDFPTALISSASLDWSMGTYESGMLCYFTSWTAAGPVNTNDFLLLEARIIPGEQTSAIYLNGIQATIFPGGGSSGPGEVAFGASGLNAYPPACDCAEILIYDRCVSDTEAAGIRAYFQSQYNYLKL